KDNDQYEVDEVHVNITCKHDEKCERCKIIVEKKVTDHVGVAPTVNIFTREVLLEKLGMEKELKEKRIVDNRAKL
ncbi:MAG: hypothetical protein ACD_26C00062G0005, partial [uncultured bacterium]